MEELGTSKRDNGRSGDFPIVTDQIVIAKDQTFERYAAIGKITVGGQGAQVDDGATDGSENLYAIAAEAVTTGVGETKTITVYLTGQFNENEISFASGTVAAYKAAARALSIFFESAVKQ